MKLISPMQRFYPRAKPKDDNGDDIPDDSDRYPVYDESELNPKLSPCGGAKMGRIHFDAAQGSEIYVMWKVVHSD
jgi:hypothetical protein